MGHHSTDAAAAPDTKTKTLCGPCSQTIDIDTLKSTAHGPSNLVTFSHHQSFPVFLASIQQGCPLCCMVWGARENENSKIREDDVEKYQDREDVVVERAFWGSPTTLCWNILLPVEGVQDQRVLIATLRSFTPEDSPLADYLPSRPIEVDSASPASIHRIHYWYTQCVNNHAVCNDERRTWSQEGGIRSRTWSRSRSKIQRRGWSQGRSDSQHRPVLGVDSDSDSKLPPRVLDLSGPSDDLRLMETRGRIGRWIALSHCWGQQQPIRTLVENLAKHTQSIPLVDLPPTFKDAVAITKSLGIQYLWIDSLCIIQDSEKDWLDNAAIMHTIYQNANLTIAAEAADGSTKGIFASTHSNRQRLNSLPIQIPATAKDGQVRGEIMVGHDIPSLRSESTKGPLSQRAWVMQEELLSRRVLRFAPHQMYWSCQTTTYSESDFTGLSGQGRWRVGALVSSHIIHEDLDKNNWYSVTNEFANRSITVHRDRLPAISAIACTFGTKLGWKYAAGLWCHLLPEGLLWRTRHPKCRKAESYTAPSWSWASVIPRKRPGETQQRGLETRTVGELEAAYSLLDPCLDLRWVRSDDPYGRVELGSNIEVVSGRIMEVCRCRIHDSNFDICDTADDMNGKYTNRLGFNFDLEKEYPGACHAAGRDEAHETLFLFHVGASIVSFAMSETVAGYAEWCLILQPEGLCGFNQYTRVGVSPLHPDRVSRMTRSEGRGWDYRPEWTAKTLKIF